MCRRTISTPMGPPNRLEILAAPVALSSRVSNNYYRAWLASGEKISFMHFMLVQSFKQVSFGKRRRGPGMITA